MRIYYRNTSKTSYIRWPLFSAVFFVALMCLGGYVLLFPETFSAFFENAEYVHNTPPDIILPNDTETGAPIDVIATESAQAQEEPTEQYVIVETPQERLERAQGARGIYITQGTLRSRRMNDLFDLIKRTELNAVVIDVKDGDGIYFDELLKEWARELKKEKVWLIARVMVFQDNYVIKAHPEFSLKTKSGALWRNYRGWYWLDPSSKEVWKYNLDVVKKAIDYGFDEINFDYIRFPSDGNLETIVYPYWDGTASKSAVITSFFKYLDEEVEQYSPQTFLSIDIFGYTFVANDLNIGQNLAMALPYFDFICPMVYPSHYSPGNFGFQNPAEHPYEVILQTFKKQEEFLKQEDAIMKIRPWLQAFNMGAIYDKNMMELQKKATYDFGIRGWLLWNANNVYGSDFLEKGDVAASALPE